MSIYVRGSTATGDVEVLRSDIDLVLVIRPFDDRLAEAEWLARLARTYGLLKRAVPILSECQILDRDDMDHSNRWVLHKACDHPTWRLIAGVPQSAPGATPSSWRLVREVLFWVWNQLPKGNRRITEHAFLDTLMIAAFMTGASPRLLFSRRAIRAQFIDRTGRIHACGEFADALNRALLRPFTKWAEPDLAAATLYLCQHLACKMLPEPPPPMRPQVYRAYQGPGFTPRQYRIIPSTWDFAPYRAAFSPGRRAVLPLTTEILQLHLTYNYPMEWHSLRHYQPDAFTLPPPTAAAVHRHLMQYAFAKQLRVAPPFEAAARLWMNPRIAIQLALYRASGQLAVSPGHLAQLYRSHSGQPFPRTAAGPRDYFLRSYPQLCTLLLGTRPAPRGSAPTPSIRLHAAHHDSPHVLAVHQHGDQTQSRQRGVEHGTHAHQE